MIKHGLMFVWLVIWLIIFIIWLDSCLEFISAPDTLLNIVGVLSLVAFVALSIWSILPKCLTIFTKEKKDD